MKRNGSYETGMIFLLSIAFGVVFFDRNATNYLSPYLVPELGLNNTQVGMISSGFSIAWALAGLVGGRLSDGAGKRKSFLVAAFIIFSLCSFLSGIAASFAILLLSRILMGVAEGPILPISQSLVALESSASRRGLNMGFMQNFGSNLIGSCFAPIVLGWLADKYGWRNAFYIAGAPGLLLAVLIWKYIREPQVHEVQPAAAPGATAADTRNMTFFEMFRFRNLWVCTLMAISMVPWMIFAWVFYPLYFQTVRHIPAQEANYLMSVLGVSAAVFSFIVPGLSDRIGRKPVMIAFCAIGVLVPLAVMFFSGSLFMLGVIVFFAWSATGVFPLFMGTIPSETIPVKYIATSLGLVMGLGELIGGGAAPTVAGWAADAYGTLNAALWIQAGLAVVGTGLAFLLKETAPVKVGSVAAGLPAPQPAI